MNILRSISLAIILIATSCSFSPQKSKPLDNGSSGTTGFAVIELFTSEGCSSCPPADRIMAELAQQYADRQVLFVGMHVDYWDRLGWKDPFSQHAFTERQHEYSNFFHNESVYTPQAIVNGRSQMVGSSRDAIVAAISEGLKAAPGKALSLHTTALADGSLQAAYTFDGEKPGNLRLVLMLVQRAAATQVKRGENGGRTLPHINIVRAMQYVQAATGQASFRLPPGLAGQEVFVAGFVQDKRTGEILGLAISS